MRPGKLPRAPWWFVLLLVGGIVAIVALAVALLDPDIPFG
jgi:hypothetical protein